MPSNYQRASFQLCCAKGRPGESFLRRLLQRVNVHHHLAGCVQFLVTSFFPGAGH
jgi:hypothetical protein